MKFGNKLTILLACSAMVLAFAGCQTTGESAGLGALIGAGAGAIIGGVAGGDDGALVGAVVGAGLGAAGGAVAHDVRRTRSQQIKPAAQTVETYDYQPAQGQSLMFEDASIDPTTVRTGDYVDTRMQYALLGASSGAQVTERRIITRDGEIVSEISAEEHNRNDGTWVSSQEFRIPTSWRKGEYVLEQFVSTDRLSVSGRVRFFVE